MINSNNSLKTRVADLEKDLADLHTKETDTAKSTDQSKLLEQLRNDIKKKDKIICEYDEKFEQLEEKMQNAVGKQRTSQSKASTLDEQLGKLQREIETLRKDNGELLLARDREASSASQERLELRKALAVAEKTMTHLTKEKLEIERRLAMDKSRPDRAAAKRAGGVHEEVQTEPMHADKAEGLQRMEVQEARCAGDGKEAEKLLKYVDALKDELKTVSEKLAIAEKRVEELGKALEEKEKNGSILQGELRKQQAENADLRKRREAATHEINKLTQQLLKRGPRLGGSTPNNNNASIGATMEMKDGKVIRHMSEAVISTKDAGKGARTMSGEQEIILSAKKELELMYKDFIRCVFHDSSSGTRLCALRVDKAEVQRLAGTIDARLNGIIEKLADYCDEQLEPVKASCLVAKLKKETMTPHHKGAGEKQQALAYMPPPPEQPFTKRVAQLQTPVGLGKTHTPLRDSSGKKQSPTHFPIKGPVRILGGPQKLGN